jgi:hypothetical protein
LAGQLLSSQQKEIYADNDKTYSARRASNRTGRRVRSSSVHQRLHLAFGVVAVTPANGHQHNLFIG